MSGHKTKKKELEEWIKENNNSRFINLKFNPSKQEKNDN